MAQYDPPPHSTDIPNPRTPQDILLRTLAIHLFSATSYYHLLSLLSFRKPHGAPLHPLLVVAFALMPELLLLQLGFWLLPILLSAPWRRMIARRARALPFELGGGNEPVGPRHLLLRAGFAAITALPLAAVLGAYRQRLGMRYHAATYVANLGLDHRNGWAAAGGLAAAVVSVIVGAGLAVVVSLGEARKDSGSVYDEVEGGTVDVRGREGKVSARLWLTRGIGEVDWPAVSEVVYATFIHNILLALTNHLVPAMVLLRSWYLLILIAGVLYWLNTKRGVSKEVLGLGTAVAFIALSAGVQIWGDGIELWRCAHGQVQPWNYRWAVRDWFSAKTKDG